MFCGTVDLTNPDAYEWYKQILKVFDYYFYGETSCHWLRFKVCESNDGSAPELQTGPISAHEPGPSLTFIFGARFRPESQIYRVNQDMCNCGVLVA